MSQVIRLLFIAGITLMTLGYQACSQIGSPSSASSSGSSNKMGGTTTDNPMAAVNVVLVNSGISSNIQLCLGQIQFSNSTLAAPSGALTADSPFPTSIESIWPAGMVTPSNDGNLDQMYAEIEQEYQNFTVVPQGSLVQSVSVASGLYTNVGLTLQDNCPYGSISVTTANGVITSSAPMVLHFTGNLTVSTSGQFVLDLGNISTALENAQTPADLSSILSSVSGTF
jgi:hypothetical protein